MQGSQRSSGEVWGGWLNVPVCVGVVVAGAVSLVRSCTIFRCIKIGGEQ